MTDEKHDDKRSPGDVFGLIDEVAAAQADMRELAKASPEEIDKRLADAGLADAAEKLRKPAPPTEAPQAKVVALPTRAHSKVSPTYGALVGLAAAIALAVGGAIYATRTPDADVAVGSGLDAGVEDAAKSAESGR